MVLFASRSIVLASAAVYLAVAALAAIGPLWVAWRAAEQDALQTAAKASAVVAERIERTLTTTNIVLARLAETARTAEGSPSAAFGFSMLEGAALTLPEPGSIWVIDGRGELMAQSISRKPIKGNFSDREYFQPHRSGVAEPMSAASSPVASPIATTG